MNESIALIAGQSTQWSDMISPFLNEQTEYLELFESAGKLLSSQRSAWPDILFICHEPGIHDGIGAAEQLRSPLKFTPFVLLAVETIDTLKAALAVGASSILEPPFAEQDLINALDRCRRHLEALRERDFETTKKATDAGKPSPLPGNDSLTSFLESTEDTLSSDSEEFDQLPLKSAIPTPVSLPTVPGEFDQCSNPLSSMKILVAEDAPMLQTVIKKQLEGIGCQAVIVDNGKEAVDRSEDGEFDAILMDLRMPVMDGFEATKLIRTREKVSGVRIPIVALSSYTLKEIMDKCLSIGMDGYLVKPVTKDKLEATLQNLNKTDDLSAQMESLLSALEGLPVLDAQSVLENIDFDLELYRELIDIYLEQYAGLGDELAEMLGKDNLKDIGTTAHSLKGMVSNIGGRRLAEVARLIQDMCHEGKTPLVTIWAPVVSAESAALKASLVTIDYDELRQLVTDRGEGR